MDNDIVNFLIEDNRALIALLIFLNIVELFFVFIGNGGSYLAFVNIVVLIAFLYLEKEERGKVNNKEVKKWIASKLNSCKEKNIA